jgi:lipoprotein-anchoring transpeptidase ErfK/SrfK
MKKNIIFAGIFSLMLLAFLAIPSKASAEEFFDAGYYALMNPDVVESVGSDSAALEAHYRLYGKAEGRMPNGAAGEGAVAAPAPAAPEVSAPAAPAAVQSSQIPADFDAGFYAERNPDVKAVYGTKRENLYRHYLDYGRAEGRPKNAAEAGEAAAPVPAADLPYQTYIDIDLTNQRVTYYESGAAVISSGCVSGNTSRGNGTPRGTYRILSHVQGKTLVGPTWRVWVDYWMQFTTSHIGLHDATWRSASQFGTDTYVSNGSHGCVNLPHDFAADLFNRVNVGTIVYVH